MDKEKTYTDNEELEKIFKNAKKVLEITEKYKGERVEKQNDE